MIKNRLLLLSLVSVLVQFVFNEVNVALIRKHNPENISINNASLVFNATIFNVDNEYYLSPAQNYIEKGVWKRSPCVSKGDYFRRVPGYSLVYYSFVKIFGFNNGHFLIRYFQLLLFGISVYCIGNILLLLGMGNKIALLGTFLFGFLPPFSGWVYFTLTDSLSIYLLVFYIYFLARAMTCEEAKKKIRYYIIASFFIGYAIYTRPFTSICLIAIVYLFVKDFYSGGIRSFFSRALLVMLIPGTMAFSWMIRNYYYTQEAVVLEKAFHPQSLDRMKPDYEALFSFAKCWGVDGPEFNNFFQPLYTSALAGDTAAACADSVLAKWPAEIVNEFGRERLQLIVKKQQASFLETKIYYDNVKAMPDTFLRSQLELRKLYYGLKDEYKSKHWFRFHFIVPMIYLKRAVFHSNTANIYLFSEEFRNSVFLNSIRYLLVGFHILMYFSLLVNLFLLRNLTLRILFVFIPLAVIFFFVYIHREIQQHYFLPTLPFIFLSFMLCIHKIKMYLSKRIHDKNIP